MEFAMSSRFIYHLHLIVLCFITAIFTPAGNAKEIRDLAKYVDPRIGVIDTGSNCVIGPQVPFGSINPSPDTPNGDHDGYNPNEPIRGFSQLHASGTGWGKYGQILVSPQTGLAVGETEHDSPKSNELAQAFEYAVRLAKYDIKAEFTPTHHAALYRFTFPQSDDAYILIDVTHNIPMDIATYVGGRVSAGEVAIDTVNANKMSGYGRYTGGFGSGDYNVYFAAEFNIPAEKYGTWKNGEIAAGSAFSKISKQDDRIGGYFHYSMAADEIILIKIAISMESVEQARAYLADEIPDWNYDAVKTACKAKWDDALSSILIDNASEKEMKIFYTALYHTMVMPRDRTGDFKNWADDIPHWDDHYAVWDTWRTVFPLMALIRSAMVRDNILSFIERLK